MIETLEAMIDEDCELVSIYYGRDVEEADAEAVLEKAQETWPQLEFELQSGGQPIYYYLLSAE